MAFVSDLLARHRQRTPSQAGVCGQAMLTPPSAKKHPGLTILGFGILLAASALVCWLTWDLRNASMVEATEQHIRLAERGAAILAKEFEVDSLLMETIRISLANPTLASLPEEALHAELFDTIGNFGGIGEIMVTDPVGRVVQSLHAHGMLHREIGQRAYFQAHRDNPAIGLQISGPLPNPYDGEPMIVLTRRLQDRGGAFAGIVLASVRVSYLQAILGRTDAGPNRLMTVMRTDGHVLLQAPAALATATPASTDPALMAAAADMPSGAYIGESSITDAVSTPSGDVFPALVQPRPAPAGEPPPTQDRVKRLYGYRTLDNAPVVLSVGTAVSDVLAQWSSTAWLIGIGAVSLDTAAILMSIAIQRELRRRRAAELQAQVSERRLRLTIETIEDHAFFLIDRHGNVAVWNSKAKAMLGYNPEDIVGRSIDVLLMHTQALRTDPNPLAVSLAVGRWEAETECRRKDGTTFPAIIVLAGIFEADDVPVAHSVIIHDLTKQKRLEQRFRAMERMDAIGQVTSGVAHDFNNLLQAQIMSLELLQDRMDAASVERELSDVALNAAEQAARLTDQLLAFSRQQRLRPSPVCLSDLLVSVISLAQHSVGPNVRLCPVVASALPPVLVDSAQLQTALLNLIINGRDAIAGSGTITLHAYQADDGIEPPAGCTSRTGFLVMSVTDTGCGMDPSTAERACEPFFTTKGAQGSGLGLSMVQGFARQSGGDIRINSKPNRGTSVEIWLPCVPPGQAVEEERAQTTRARSAHILLVDDAPDVLLVLSAFLRGAGFAVTRAGNAREALWHLQRGTKFALLISDFLMPGMDGLDLAHQAHRSRPDLPVLIISGFAASDRLSNLPPGFALLRKPFRKEDLLAAVARLQGGPGESASGSAGPLGAGAVVEPSSWDEPPHSHELPPKPTSA